MESIEIKINGILLLTLESKNDWIRKCPNRLPEKMRYKEQFLFVDAKGNVLENGGDFMAAEKIDSYPVKVYRTITTSQYDEQNQD